MGMLLRKHREFTDVECQPGPEPVADDSVGVKDPGFVEFEKAHPEVNSPKSTAKQPDSLLVVPGDPKKPAEPEHPKNQPEAKPKDNPVSQEDAKKNAEKAKEAPKVDLNKNGNKEDVKKSI